MKKSVVVLGSLAAFTLSACGGGGSSSTPTASDAMPSISAIDPSMSMLQDSSSDPISFDVADAETEPAALEVAVSSSNPQLLAADGVSLGGYGAHRSLIITPELGQSGTTELTLSVKDAAGQVATQKVMLDVTAQQKSFYEFAVASIGATPDSQPAETAGADWVDTEENDPAAFDSLLQPIAG